MGKILRKTRIELSKFDVNWKGSFVVVGTTGFNDQKKFAIDLSKLQREQEKKTRKYNQAKRRLEKLIEEEKEETEEFQEAEKEEETLYQEADKLSYEVLDFMQKSISSRFLSGQVYDEELKGEKKLREMASEDILDFDWEVLTEISRKIAGQLPKND
jgi:hypothetical protein